MFIITKVVNDLNVEIISVCGTKEAGITTLYKYLEDNKITCDRKLKENRIDEYKYTGYIFTSKELYAVYCISEYEPNQKTYVDVVKKQK